MKAKRFAALALTGLVAAALVAPVGTATAKPKKKSGPVVVATDVNNDWGAAADPTIQPIGQAAGMELVEASIAMADAKTVNFVIKVAALPPNGGVPEGVRYTWDFIVNGESLELDGKWTNYSRGACDPTDVQCPPPRDPGQQPFLIRGECGPHPAASNLVVCAELGLVKATFDTAASTITIPVPLELIGAKPGMKIEPGTNSTFGGSVVAIPSAFVSNANMPHDIMTTLKSFSIPK